MSNHAYSKIALNYIHCPEGYGWNGKGCKVHILGAAIQGCS